LNSWRFASTSRQRRNDFGVAFAVGFLRGAHAVEHEVLRLRHAIEGCQAVGQRLERVQLPQIEQSISRALDAQRSLQMRDGFLMVPGCGQRIAESQRFSVGVGRRPNLLNLIGRRGARCESDRKRRGGCAHIYMSTVHL
jgi:hypothetical protein